MPCTNLWLVTLPQVGPWHCEFCDDVAALKSFGAANQETLAELLVAFFDYWAWRHDYNSSVVSIRVPGGIISKASKNWCVEGRCMLSAGRDLGKQTQRHTFVYQCWGMQPCYEGRNC